MSIPARTRCKPWPRASAGCWKKRNRRWPTDQSNEEAQIIRKEIADDAAAEGVAGLESLIGTCESEIDELKSLYTLFFSGDLKLPPEKLRTKVERNVRYMLVSETKSPHLNLKIQNLASKFNLYNNLWLKRLNEIESGMANRPGIAKAAPPAAVPPSGKGEIRISLNDETTFDKLYDYYQQVAAKNSLKPNEREKVINSIKSKMIINNMVETDLTVAVLKGKISLKIKK